MNMLTNKTIKSLVIKIIYKWKSLNATNYLAFL